MKRFFTRHAGPATDRRFLKIRRLLPIMLIPAAILLTPGCSRKIYVPVESMKIQRDTVTTVRIDHDSILIKDSVTIASRNDTVFKESYRWRIRNRLVRDTLLKTRLDTVYIEKPLSAASQSGQAANSSFGQRLTSAFRRTLLSPLLLLVFLFLIYRLLRSHK